MTLSKNSLGQGQKTQQDLKEKKPKKPKKKFQTYPVAEKRKPQRADRPDEMGEGLREAGFNTKWLCIVEDGNIRVYQNPNFK